jgi:hypothetical protein
MFTLQALRALDAIQLAVPGSSSHQAEFDVIRRALCAHALPWNTWLDATELDPARGPAESEADVEARINEQFVARQGHAMMHAARAVYNRDSAALLGLNNARQEQVLTIFAGSVLGQETTRGPLFDAMLAYSDNPSSITYRKFVDQIREARLNRGPGRGNGAWSAATAPVETVVQAIRERVEEAQMKEIATSAEMLFEVRSGPMLV